MIPSKNPQVEELTKSHKERSVDLSSLKAVKVDGVRYCAWCTEKPLHHGNQKYCNQNCADSAWAWAYPQKEHALHFLLQRQDFKCAICLYDYAPLLEEIAKKMHGGRSYNRLVNFREELYWPFYKRLKSQTPKEHRPEVDHILAISKGGQSLGLDNHQCICYTCHKAKTKIDNSGPRKKRTV